MRKSRVQIIVKGLNQERTLNRLSKTVSVLRVDRKDKHICTLEVAPKEYKKAKRLLEENSFEIVKVQAFGVYSWWRRLISSYGVIVGIILCLCGYFVQLGFVWQIKVYGVDKLSIGEVTAFIEKNLTSRYSSKVDTKSLEVGLRENFKRISSVSVAIVGQSLVVNLNEAVLPEEMNGEFQPIICEYDCKITEIKLVQGTLRVKVGEIVQAGEVLVEPYIIDSEGQQRSVKPMASIKADVWFSERERHFDSYYRTIRTGNVLETSEVLLFGVSVYKHGKGNTFKQFDVEETVSDLSQNLLLPFKLKTLKYYETKTELVEESFESACEQLIAATREKTLQNLKEYEIIKEEDYTISEAGGVHTVTFSVTVNREIVGGT